MKIKQSRRDFFKTASVAALAASLKSATSKAQVSFINLAPLKGSLLTTTSLNTVEVNNIIDRLTGQLPLLNDMSLHTDIWNITGNNLGYGSAAVGCTTDQFSDIALGINTGSCSGNTGNTTCGIHACRDDQCPNLTCDTNYCNGQVCNNNGTSCSTKSPCGVNTGCNAQTDPLNVNPIAWDELKNTLLSIINQNPSYNFNINLTYQTQNY